MKFWQKRMVRQLLYGDPMEFDKVVEIKEGFIPNKLYRYGSINDNQINNLIQSVVYLSHPNDFNDPYDAGFLLDSKTLCDMSSDGAIRKFEASTSTVFSEEEKRLLKTGKNLAEVTLSRFSDKEFDRKCSRKKLIQLSEHIINNHITQMIKELEYALKHTLRICCFTTRFDNMSMWHHYANGHSGICIEYDTVDTYKLFRRLLFPVVYDNVRFDANIFLKNIFDDDFRPSQFPFYASIFKSKDWEYEDEWRLVIPGGALEQQPFVRVKINAIYLGRKISDINKRKVLEICKKSNINVYQVDICNSNRYTLIATEVTE